MKKEAIWAQVASEQTNRKVTVILIRDIKYEDQRKQAGKSLEKLKYIAVCLLRQTILFIAHLFNIQL